MVRKIHNLPKGLKLISKMALKKWNTNFCVEYSTPKNRTTFSDVPIASGDFLLERPKRRVPFTLQPDSSSVPLQTKRRQEQFF